MLDDMHMPYGKSHTAGYATRNQKAKLAADYQELLKELSTTTNIQSVGNYVLEKTLGEGSYGKVKLATHKLTGRKVAIKIIPKIHAENLTREIHHHRYLHHPNIISLLEVIPTETKIYIVLEYCEGGELYDFLVVRGRLRENLARKMFGQLCRAVKYCHDRRVVHRDLKLENILLDSHNNIKLADFGFTRECESKRLLETICGSTGYSAPEMLRGNKYSGLEIDIWSLGVILYTLLCGVLPFDDDDENEMRNKIIKGEYEMEEFLSDEAQDLIRSILQLEPSERPTLKQILQHAWFKMKDEEEYDDDDWATSDEIADDESISSIEENSLKEPIKEVTITSSSKDIHLDATSHLERQRQEIFLATKQQHNASLPNHYPMTFTRHNNSYNNNNVITSTSSIAPSAFKSRMKSFSPAAGPSPPKVLGPSTSKTSRRSSIDSKAFNEKVFFTTPEEKELLEKLENLGLDITGIKDSVLEGKVDSASGLWWLLLAKLREKRKIEGVQSSVTMVNVAVGTSDEEIEIAEETEEEYDSPENSIELDRLHEEDVKDVDSIKSSENLMSPPTPPPKTYHAAPASRERRKSLILSLPEAVEPVLTTITATASPPLSPKKFSSFTSPISSRSVSPIPSINPMPMPISNSKNAYRKRGGLLSTIKGWWGGSHNPKDVNSAYKKNMLNWAENGVVVPADVAHVRSRMNRRRSGSKTPPGFEGANSFSLSRRSSSINRGSFRDKKKKKIPIQGIKGGNKRATPTPAPLMIPPVTPSIVLSQSSPTIMSPIPGTPPASRPKTLFTKNRRIPFAYQGSSRKQVKRRSINSINNLLENFNTGAGSGSSEDNTNHVNNLTNNNEQKKDTFEKSAIENIISKDEHTIDEQLMVVESSKSKTITLASPPPTPPPNNKDNHSSTNPSRISKCEQVGSQNVDNRKKSEETLISNLSDGDESDVFVDAASTFTYNPRSRSASPSTSASPSPNNSPVIKPEVTIVSPPSFSSPQPRSPISITPPRPQSQTTSPVSPPLSPIENVIVPPSSLHSKNNAHKTQARSDASRTSFRRGEQSEENVSPIEKSIPPPTKSVMNLMSTPPESPKLSKPTPSSAYLHPQSKYRQNARSYSSPAALSLNNVSEDNMEDNHHHGDNNNKNSSSSSSSSINGIKNIGIDNKRDSSHSPPNMNASQMMFLQNNGRNTRQRTYFNQSSSINRTSIAKPPKPAMIIEEEEEE